MRAILIKKKNSAKTIQFLQLKWIRPTLRYAKVDIIWQMYEDREGQGAGHNQQKINICLQMWSAESLWVEKKTVQPIGKFLWSVECKLNV